MLNSDSATWTMVLLYHSGIMSLSYDKRDHVCFDSVLDIFVNTVAMFSTDNLKKNSVILLWTDNHAPVKRTDHKTLIFKSQESYYVLQQLILLNT